MSQLADSPMTPTVRRYEAQRAPVGGVSIDGQFYPGGQYIPGEVADSPEGQAAIKAAKEQPTDAAGSGVPPSGPAAGTGHTGRVSAGPVQMDFGALPSDPETFVEQAGLAAKMLEHAAEGAQGAAREIFDVGNDFFHARFRDVLAKHGPVMGPLILAAGMAGYAAGMAAPAAAPVVGGLLAGPPGALAGGALLGADFLKMGMPGRMLGGKGPIVAPLTASIGAAMAAAPFIAAQKFLAATLKSGWEVAKSAGNAALAAEKRLDRVMFPPRERKPMGEPPAWVKAFKDSVAPHAIQFSAEEFGGGLDMDVLKRLAAEAWQGMLGEWFAEAGEKLSLDGEADEWEEEDYDESTPYAADESKWTEEKAPRAKSGKRWRNKATGKVTYTDPTQGKKQRAPKGEKPSGERLGGEGEAKEPERKKPADIPTAELAPTAAELETAYQTARQQASDLKHKALRSRDPEQIRQAAAAEAKVRDLGHKLESARKAPGIAKALAAGAKPPSPNFVGIDQHGNTWANGRLIEAAPEAAGDAKPKGLLDDVRKTIGPDGLTDAQRKIVGSPGNMPPEPGFTGTDKQGRQWQNGKLVAKQEEPGKGGGKNPYPAGPGGFEHQAFNEGAAGGYTNPHTPGTPEHKAFNEGAASRQTKENVGKQLTPGAEKHLPKVAGTQTGRITPEGQAAAERAKAKREESAAKPKVAEWKAAAQKSIANAAATKKVDAGPVQMDMNKIPDNPQTLLGQAKDFAAKVGTAAEKVLVGAPPELQQAGDTFWQNGFEGLARAHGYSKAILIAAAGVSGVVASYAATTAMWKGVTGGDVSAGLLSYFTHTEKGDKTIGWLTASPVMAASALISRGYHGAKKLAGRSGSDFANFNDTKGSGAGGPFSSREDAEPYEAGGSDLSDPQLEGVDMEEIKTLAATEWSKLMAGWYEEADKVMAGAGGGEMADAPMEPAPAPAQ